MYTHITYECINCQRKIEFEDVSAIYYIDFCDDLCIEYFCKICYQT